jgi:hypothetical protein
MRKRGQALYSGACFGQGEGQEQEWDACRSARASACGDTRKQKRPGCWPGRWCSSDGLVISSTLRLYLPADQGGRSVLRNGLALERGLLRLAIDAVKFPVALTLCPDRRVCHLLAC